MSVKVSDDPECSFLPTADMTVKLQVRKAAAVVTELELDDLLDRLFIPRPLERSLNGLSSVLQDGFTLTALDKRRYAPAIESALDREENADGVCETFGISQLTAHRLKALGFKSTALMALLLDVSDQDNVLLPLPKVQRLSKAQPQDLKALRRCVKELNKNPQEPLYSVKRLVHFRRQMELGRGGGLEESLEYLDIGLPDKKSPRGRDLFQYAVLNDSHDILCRATFKVKKGRLPRHLGSTGFEDHVSPLQQVDCPTYGSLPGSYYPPAPANSAADGSQAPQVVFVPYVEQNPPFQPFILSPTLPSFTNPYSSFFSDHLLTPSSSSSNSLNEDYERFHDDLDEYFNENDNRGVMRSSPVPPFEDQGTFCPFLDCSRSMKQFYEPFEEHLRVAHNGYNVITKARPFLSAPPPSEQQNQRLNNSFNPTTDWYFSQFDHLGHIEVSVDVAVLSPDYFWWGPKVFLQNGIQFFVVVFKLRDNEGPPPIPPNKTGSRASRSFGPRMVFYVQANTDEETADKYAYDVEFVPGINKQFRGKVFPLVAPRTIPSRKDATNDNLLIQRMVYYFRSDLARYRHSNTKIAPKKIDFKLGLYKKKSL